MMMGIAALNPSYEPRIRAWWQLPQSAVRPAAIRRHASRRSRRARPYPVRPFRPEMHRMKYLLALLLVVSLSGCELLPVELGGPGKGLVCHKGKKTLELPREAIGAHLDHGDYRGACH